MDNATPRAKRDHEVRQLLQSMRERLVTGDPRILAQNTGMSFDEATSDLLGSVLGRDFSVQYPAFVAHERNTERRQASLWVQILLMHYFRTADGAAVEHDWISYRELPAGMFYQRAFQGYSGDKLARIIGEDQLRLREACLRLGGSALQIGDIAFAFPALPRVPIAVAFWTGDDEFPANAKVLFDRSAPHYLPTDGLAVVGARLCNLILYAAGLAEDPFDEGEELESLL